MLQREKVDKVFGYWSSNNDEVYIFVGKEVVVYPNDVSLNTIMVDGTGMCGACRLTIGGKTKFVCIDGPEFNGDLVDWDEMFRRMGTFRVLNAKRWRENKPQIRASSYRS